jgi:hypothetical protein
MVCGLQRIGLLPCQGRHARFDEVEFFFAATGRSRAEPLQPEADLTSGTKSALKTKKSPGSIHIEPRLAFVCSKLV